jgi:hypothetical protein
MQLLNPPLSYYVDLLNSGQPFALSRFGDGEWAWLLDIPWVNEEGHNYFPEMARELRESLNRNHPMPFHYARPELRVCHNQEQITAYCERLNVTWYDCSTFRIANFSGELYPLVEALRQRRVIMVGPEHLAGLKAFPFVDHIKVPGSNVYKQKVNVLWMLKEVARLLSPDIIAFSAGPLSNILIDELWDGSTTLIDFGSLWDPYVGVKSRRYMRQDLSERLKKNLGE